MENETIKEIQVPTIGAGALRAEKRLIEHRKIWDETPFIDKLTRQRRRALIRQANKRKSNLPR